LIEKCTSAVPHNKSLFVDYEITIVPESICGLFIDQRDKSLTHNFGDQDTLFLLVCMRVRSGPLLTTTRQRDGQSPTETAVGSVEKDVGVQRHHAFMVCHARVWIGTPTVQLASRGDAAVQFFLLISKATQ